MNLELHWLDMTMLGLYLTAIAMMGIWFSRKNISTEEYFVGGRSFPGWAVGLSLVGTSISSVTFLAYPADSFKSSWIRLLPLITLPVAVLIASRIFIPFFRRGRVTSAYEYLEWRFGRGIRLYASVTFVLGQLIRNSMILYLVSLLMYEMTGLHLITCIFFSGVFVAFYTVIGGINAVIWTDIIQTVVLALGGIVTLGVIIAKLPGGFGEIFSVATSHGKFSFSELVNGELHPISWNISLHSKTGTMLLLMGLTYWLTEYCGNQNIVQRYVASKSAKEARKAMWICTWSSLSIWVFFMFLGTALFVFFKAFPSPEVAEMLEGSRKAEHIFPFYIIHYLPPGITGLLIVAALAAAMSSLDSSINAVSTVCVVDLYRRFCVKGRDDRHYLLMAKLFAALMGVLMIGGAILLVWIETKTLRDTGAILSSLLAGGLLAIYLMGFLTRRGDARAVGIGIICTIIFSVWAVLSNKGILPDWMSAPFELYYTSIIGNLIMFIVGFAIGTLLPKKERDLTNLTVWDQDSTPVE